MRWFFTPVLSATLSLWLQDWPSRSTGLSITQLFPLVNIFSLALPTISFLPAPNEMRGHLSLSKEAELKSSEATQMERRDRAVRREGKKSLRRVGVNRLVPLHFLLATLVWGPASSIVRAPAGVRRGHRAYSTPGVLSFNRDNGLTAPQWSGKSSVNFQRGATEQCLVATKRALSALGFH